MSWWPETAALGLEKLYQATALLGKGSRGWGDRPLTAGDSSPCD